MFQKTGNYSIATKAVRAFSGSININRIDELVSSSDVEKWFIGTDLFK